MPKHLLFARAADRSGSFGMCAPLAGMMLESMEPLRAMGGNMSSGVAVRAAWSRGGGPGLSSFFIAIGPEPDGEQLIQALRQTLA
jgi:hypothetical protein